jgi:hypothetical protein
MRLGEGRGLALLEDAVSATATMQVKVNLARRLIFLAEGRAIAGLRPQGHDTLTHALAVSEVQGDMLSKAYALQMIVVLGAPPSSRAEAEEGASGLRAAAALARRLGAKPLESACLRALAPADARRET